MINQNTYNIKYIIKYRLYLICYFIFFVLIALIIRLGYIQIINSYWFIKAGNMRTLRMYKISDIRGNITDRKGFPLAVSIPANAICADPKIINDNGGIDSNDIRWNKLSEAISLPLSNIYSLINKNSKKRFIYLSRQLHPMIGDFVEKLRLCGIYLNNDSKRYYPSGRVTAHILGITDIDNHGIEGIEKSFDSYLLGKYGIRKIRKNKTGDVVEDILLIKQGKSRDLTLSIDNRLQALVYRELKNSIILNKADSGSIVLLDIHNGEILAMVNSPTYNPNNLTKKDIKWMRNNAITDVFEPGSTIKPIVLMAALKHGSINKNTIINTEPYLINGFKIKDVVNYPKLNVCDILKKSSNVGISKIALSIPASVLINTYLKFGINQYTNIELVGESKGFFPYKKKWSKIDQAILSYGYGFMITPLQLARIYATIGSMGILRPLTIIRRDATTVPIQGKQIFSKSIVKLVLNMMESVALPGGSGSKAAVEGYTVAVKTGTVKKIGFHGKYINKYIAYTAGIAPARNPRFSLVVLINNPKGKQYYGGMVSAPIFSKIMQNVLRIMNIKPDA